MKKEVGPGGSVHQSKQGTLRQGWMRERERANSGATEEGREGAEAECTQVGGVGRGWRRPGRRGSGHQGMGPRWPLKRPLSLSASGNRYRVWSSLELRKSIALS